MVEFFKTSIACKAIKYLLSQTALPLFKTITSDEFIMRGCIYVYKDKLIKCTKSGRFEGLNSSLSYDDHLYVNEHITVSDDPDYIKRRAYSRNPVGNLDIADTVGVQIPVKPPETAEYPKMDLPQAVPTGIGALKKQNNLNYYDDYLTVTDDVVTQYLRPFAEVEVLQDFQFGVFQPGLSYYHISNSNYYDTDTHYYLGEYLRCLRDIKGIDLMCLYNCFTYKYVDNVFINVNDDKKIPNYLEDTLPYNKKVTLIPIKFNKKYTIVTSCDFKIEVKSVLYKDELMKNLNGDAYLCEQLMESYRTVNNIQFENPYIYSIETDNPEMLEYEKYLYLALQLPITHNEPIVVLEGDYSQHADRYISDIASIEMIPEVQLAKMFKSKLSLLFNDGKQKPFADVLVEYLFENTIDCREMIDDNVTNIEDRVHYFPKYNGHWSNTLRYILYNKYINCEKQDLDKNDVLGFVDSKMEAAIQKGWIINGR